MKEKDELIFERKEWQIRLFLASPMIADGLITFLILPNISTENFIQKYPDYKNLIQPLIQATQIILGLVAAVSIFYLGKVHEYNKENIKEEGKFYGLSLKIKPKKKIASETEKKET